MTSIRRTDDFDRLNDLLNDPSIYPWVRGDYDGYLDARECPNPSIIIEAEHGAFWFVAVDEGVWEAHTAFPPSVPGTYERALEAIYYVKGLPGYKKIVTQGPRSNPRAKRFLEKLGFTYTHTEGTYQGLPLDHYEYK